LQCKSVKYFCDNSSVLLHSHVKVIATDFLRRFGPIVIISKFQFSRHFTYD